MLMPLETPLKRIMSTNLVTVAPDTNAGDILNLFKKNAFHHIPVVEKDHKIIGLISKDDFYQLAYQLVNNSNGVAIRTLSQALSASDMMTRSPLVLEPDDTVGLAADIFLANRFHALPLVEDGELVGIVTTHDLLKFAFDSEEDYGD